MKDGLRIGIYAGTFNPVHAGHITFALQAIQAASLDKVYFLPERRPRHKTDVEHFGHRVAMLERATRPHPQFEVMELVDVSFSVERTLPKLRKAFPDSQLVFLFGSDVVGDLPDWPRVERLLKDSELVIGLRQGDEVVVIKELISEWPQAPIDLILFDSFAPHVSSGRIREALRRRKRTAGLLRSVEHYSNRHWLYVSLAD